MTNPFFSYALRSLCLIGVVCCSCQKRQESLHSVRPLPVEIQVIDTLHSSVLHTYVGEVQGIYSTPLSFPLGGRLTAIETSNNAHVKAGQVLMQVDNTQALNLLHNAQASLKQAQDGYNRLKQVYEQGGIPEVKWIEIQTQTEKAESMVASAEKTLHDCTLHAPHDGIITGLDLQCGQELSPHQRVATLLDINAVNIVFHVPETEISQLATGDKANITIPALNDAVYVGKISEKNLTGNKLSHTYSVKTTLPNPQHALMPGMVCKVEIQQHHTNGFVIPAHCIQVRPEGHSVWTLHNGTTQRKIITTGQFVKNGILVSSGLTQGDTLITNGYQKLYTDAPVSIRQ